MWVGIVFETVFCEKGSCPFGGIPSPEFTPTGQEPETGMRDGTGTVSPEPFGNGNSMDIQAVVIRPGYAVNIGQPDWLKVIIPESTPDMGSNRKVYGPRAREAKVVVPKHDTFGALAVGPVRRHI